MARTVDFKFTNQGDEFLQRIGSFKKAEDFLEEYKTNDRIGTVLEECYSADHHETLAEAVEGKSFLDNTYINGRNLSDICSRKYQGFAECDKTNQNSIMALEYYSEMVKREKLIQVALPDEKNPENFEIVTVNPDIKDRNRGIFARIGDWFRELAGAKGTNSSYKNIAKAREQQCTQMISTKINEEAEKRAAAREIEEQLPGLREKLAETQPERDAIQLQMLDNLGTLDRSLNEDKAFFGYNNEAEEFTKDGEAMGLKALSRAPTRANIARLYTMLYGFDGQGLKPEQLLSDDRSIERQKKLQGDMLKKAVAANDKETLCEFAADAVKYFAKKENYPQCDLTSDKGIAQNYVNAQFIAHIIRDLDQSILHKDAPYMDYVRKNVPGETLDKYFENTENFSYAQNTICQDGRVRMICSDMYSKAYKDKLTKNEEAKYIGKDDTPLQLGYAASDAAHQHYKEHGKNIVNMPVVTTFGVRTALGKYNETLQKSDPLTKEYLSAQITLNMKPKTTPALEKAKEESIKNSQSLFDKTDAKKDTTAEKKKDVSEEFTAQKPLMQTQTQQTQKQQPQKNNTKTK